MSTLAQIEAAADALSPEEKAELVRFLSAQLHPIDKKSAGGASLVAGPNGVLLLEAPPGAPPMTTAVVKQMLEDFP